MIRRYSELKRTQVEHMKDGNGVIKFTHILNNPDEMLGKGRLFAQLTVDPGCSIGQHTHEGDAEIFYVLSGEATTQENGQDVTLYAGDMAVCNDGESHFLANRTNEPLKLIALILYK